MVGCMDNDRLAEVTAVHGALGHRTRVRILLALFDGRGPMRYNELMAAIDAADSGRFNYHLNELVDGLVRRDEDGYRLTLQGKLLMSSVAAGRYRDAVDDYAVPVDRPCPACGANGMSLVQQGAMPAIRCPSCGLVFDRYGPFPTAAWESHPPEAVTTALAARVRTAVDLARTGVCHDCYSPLQRRVHREPDALPSPYYPERDLGIRPLFDCTTCTNYLPIPYAQLAWFDEAVGAFLEDHGIEPRATPPWMIDHVVDAMLVERTASDPPRVAVTFAVDEDCCRAVVDGDLRVDGVTNDGPPIEGVI